MALGDILSAFKVKDMPSKEKMDACIDKSLKKLYKMQHLNGGFGFWSLIGPTYIYLSVQVAHGNFYNKFLLNKFFLILSSF